MTNESLDKGIKISKQIIAIDNDLLALNNWEKNYDKCSLKIFLEAPRYGDRESIHISDAGIVYKISSIIMAHLNDKKQALTDEFDKL